MFRPFALNWLSPPVMVAMVAASISFTQVAVAATAIPSAADSRFGWQRGDAGSTFAGWIVLANEEPGPQIFDSTPDVEGTNTTGTLRETTGTAFVTSGGNIYSFAGTTVFESFVGGPNLAGSDVTTRVVAQFRTQGTELGYDTIRLSGGSLTNVAPLFTQELGRTVLGGFGGTLVDYLVSWDLPGSESQYRIDFSAASSSMSLDRFLVDSYSVAAVPEPTSLALVAVVAAGAFAARRMRQRRLTI